MKWFCIIVTIAISILWISSGWFSYRLCTSPSTLLALENGRIFVGRNYQGLQPGAWSFQRFDFQFVLWFGFGGLPSHIWIPLWFPLLLAAAPAFAAAPHH